MLHLTRARVYDALTHPSVHGRLGLDEDTIAAICDALTAEQPHERGHAAPHGPHSPSGAPEDAATRDRVADRRTVVRERLEHARDAAALHRQGLLSTAELYAVIEADPAEPPAWIDGDPLMEAIAAGIWEHCRTEGTSLVVDDPRNIAAVAAHITRTTPDNRTDSPDSRQDSTPDTETDSPATSADTVRTAPDTGPCPQHPGAPVIGGMCGGCTIYPADMAGRRPPMDPVHILGIGAPAVEPHPAEAERDQAYRERAHLLAWLAALHPANAVITPAADIDEPGWQLLYLLVGGWQMSWHIHPRDADLFRHVEHVDPDDPRVQWDGHSTAKKYERIQQHVRRIAADRP